MRRRPNETTWTTDVAETDFRLLFEQLHDPAVEFLFCDEEPVIVQANDAFVDVFCDGDSIPSRWLNDLLVPVDSIEDANEINQQIMSHSHQRRVVERMTIDGPRSFLYRGVPIAEDRGFAIYTDITERVRRKKHLDVLHRVLRHNLRNDTNIITSGARQALRTAENESTRENLQTVIRTSDGLSHLCSEAATIRKVLTSDFSTHPVGFDSIVYSVVSDCASQFEDADIGLDAPDDLLVLADSRLEILVEGLVDNALRHNSSSPSKVYVSLTECEEMAEFVVADNGPGIPEVEQKIVTDDLNVSSLEHGSGLGLWLVKWLVRSYGGHIEIETHNRKGSVVIVELPLAD